MLDLFREAILDEDYLAAQKIKDEFIHFHCLDDYVLRVATSDLLNDLFLALDKSETYQEFAICAEPLIKWYAQFEMHKTEVITNIGYVHYHLHRKYLECLEDEVMEMMLEGDLHPVRLIDLTVLLFELMEESNDFQAYKSSLASAA
jgi:hypothetical protein